MNESNSERHESTALQDYQSMIDALVAIRSDVCAARVIAKQPWPNLPENREINSFLATLSDKQRETLVVLLQHSRDGGIHDVLAYLTDEINSRGLRLVRHGRELPVEPFGTEMYWDWTCRREGDPWPKL